MGARHLLLLLGLGGLAHVPGARGVPVTRRLLRDADSTVLDDGVRARDLPALLGLPSPPRHPSASHPSSPRHRAHHRRHRARNLLWLKEALVYLRGFGYLAQGPLRTEDVWTALAEFQEVAGLGQTGQLDPLTLSAMHRPRCGNPDFRASPVPELHPARRKRFAQVSRWNEVDDNGTLELRWFIEKYTKDIPREDVRQTVRQAFNLWANQVPIPSMRSVTLLFSEGTDADNSDITILWATNDHGDAYPFDGPGNQTNILAHTFYPNYEEKGTLNGDIHFDEHEKWTLDGDAEEGVHFPYVLVHEIGHALGLGHSKRQEAVMNPIYKKFSLDNVLLDIDDKCAMHWNYVGPSNTCLFVWLMVELLPRARDSNLTAHGIGSVINIDADDVSANDVWAQRSLQDRLNRTLHTFTNAKIPQCAETNDVQDQYEVLLEKQLAFPPQSARKFGPVVCNFLEGLSRFSSDVAREGRRERRRRRAQRHSPRRSVHAWPSHAAPAAFARLLPSTSPPLPHSRRTRRHPHTLSPLDKDYFDTSFFHKLLSILVHSPALPIASPRD